MSARRIAITGVGSINAHGTGVAAFERGLRAGRCAVGEVTVFPAEGYRSTIAAEVPGLAAPAHLASPVARRASRSSLLALVAADEAVRTASLDAAFRARAGVVVGTTTGGTLGGEESVRQNLSPAARARRLSQWL